MKYLIDEAAWGLSHESVERSRILLGINWGIYRNKVHRCVAHLLQFAREETGRCCYLDQLFPLCCWLQISGADQTFEWKLYFAKWHSSTPREDRKQPAEKMFYWRWRGRKCPLERAPPSAWYSFLAKTYSRFGARSAEANCVADNACHREEAWDSFII